jgi:hypothetical protein
VHVHMGSRASASELRSVAVENRTSSVRSCERSAAEDQVSAFDACFGAYAETLRCKVASGELEELAIPTDDGGMTFELSSRATEREVVFAIPADGSVRYFLARGESGFRRAGVVVDVSAFASLARWLESPSVAFPTVGLQLG